MSDFPLTAAISAIAGADGRPAAALEAGAAYAPYLGRLIRRRPDILSRLGEASPDEVAARALADMAQADADGAAAPAVMRNMRRAKEAGHMAIAAADLAGEWPLDRVVAALTQLADTATATALRSAARALAPDASRVGPDGLPGLFVLAMGKMGAHELNYSSDIDLIVLFDPDGFPVEASRARETAVRITREMVRLLEERTEDGYVFRTDLRLRPDPGSTQVAVSTTYAHGYYESVGQNWERMAHLKARVCAGDAAAGAAYLDGLVPYIWRRHLDYWAIADIHSIKRQIHAQGRHAPVDAADFDVKLGRGGVREIEFFVQTQQLILGGRRPGLRLPATKAALAALVGEGVVEAAAGRDLTVAYDFLRGVEHRIQMLNDEQTHKLPERPEVRERVSAMCGAASREAFETAVAAVRQRVHGIYSDLFAQEEKLSGQTGNLVFTGVDDDPGTVAQLTEMGFSNPSHVIDTIRRWHRGGTPATRTARGQQLLTILAPRLLQAMSEGGEPDAAFLRFSDFLTRLSAGVQTLSLMLAQPALTRDIIATMSFAPKLAIDLARRPALLDAMLEPHFRSPVPHDPAGDRMARLARDLSATHNFEDSLNRARRFHREEAFRIGYQLLRRLIWPSDAGAAYADLADACVAELAKVAAREIEARFGAPPSPFAVCALGKFGGRELSSGSDLDIMVVYAPDGSLEADTLATRFTQRLIAALSAPTEEGALYEVDTQLRPSGRAGPVAVKLSAFESYYQADAWTWEFLALTRLRAVAGDPDVCARVEELARAAIARRSQHPAVDADTLDMRRRMARERKPRHGWDFKLAPGGLVDIEFVVQHAMLKAAGARPDVLSANSADAIGRLVRAGVIDAPEAADLQAALELQLDLQQALRIAAPDGLEPSQASAGLKAWLAFVCGFGDFAALEEELAKRQAAAESVRARRIGPLVDG